jgi:hypothetical protein
LISEQRTRVEEDLQTIKEIRLEEIKRSFGDKLTDQSYIPILDFSENLEIRFLQDPDLNTGEERKVNPNQRIA